jgi:hypothetical protein
MAARSCLTVGDSLGAELLDIGRDHDSLDLVQLQAVPISPVEELPPRAPLRLRMLAVKNSMKRRLVRSSRADNRRPRLEHGEG